MILAEGVFAVIVSFVLARVALPYWIRRSREQKLLITDVQKIPAVRIAHLAGLIVVPSAVVGLLCYIAGQTFLRSGEDTTVLLASVGTLLIALLIGVVDDLLGERIGLRQYQKPILTVFAALPMVVINAGHDVMYVPLLGAVNFGYLYPFVVVPLGIVGASNGFNMLAGVNGLEAGMALIALGTLGFLSALRGFVAAEMIAFCFIAAILVLFWYNKFPAQVLSGNGFTYAAGTAIAVVAIVGDNERSAVLLFIPYFVEFVLKLRGMFQKESLAVPMADGSLRSKYVKWYSLNHVVISFLRKVKRRAYEWEITGMLLGFELVIALGVIALAVR